MRAVIVLALVAVVSADVSHLKTLVRGSEADAQIVAQKAVVNPKGYEQSYETSNGIQAKETGEIKNAGQKDEALSVTGEAHWTAPDGTPMDVSYTANENGFFPKGVHLPKSIARALAYILEHPRPEQQKDFY